uniref:Uncharacterized protein n=1 Tax=Arion vulgaris TaxID=1028688 RepID=A0A0B6YLC8_9EUPU
MEIIHQPIIFPSFFYDLFYGEIASKKTAHGKEKVNSKSNVVSQIKVTGQRLHSLKSVTGISYDKNVMHMSGCDPTHCEKSNS